MHFLRQSSQGGKGYTVIPDFSHCTEPLTGGNSGAGVGGGMSSSLLSFSGKNMMSGTDSKS